MCEIFFLANFLTLPRLFSFSFQPVMLTSGISESEHRGHELTQSTLQLVPSTWKEAGRFWGRGGAVLVIVSLCFVYFGFCFIFGGVELGYF